MKLPSPDTIARQFCRELIRFCGPGNIAKINRRNARRNDNSCTTHDFCDANVLMDAAFKHITGKDTDDLSKTIPGFNRDTDGCIAQEVNAIWNEAWELARLAKFNPDNVGKEILYTVQYHIDLHAATPRAAALETLRHIRDNGGEAAFFVKPWNGKDERVPKGYATIDLANA